MTARAGLARFNRHCWPIVAHSEVSPAQVCDASTNGGHHKYAPGLEQMPAGNHPLVENAHDANPGPRRAEEHNVLAVLHPFKAGM